MIPDVRSLLFTDSLSGVTNTSERSTDVEITRAERAERDLDAMIARRDLQRREREGARRERELWEESVAKYNAHRQRELARQWLEYHIARQRTHRYTFALLDAHHEQEIARYSAMLADGKEQTHAT